MTPADVWWDGRAPVRVAILLDVVGWAAVLSSPGNTFATSHSYDLMGLWFSQDQWAVLFGVAALGLLFFWRQANRVLRAVSVGYACVLQAAIAVSFGAAPVLGTGFLTHVGIALLGSWLVWRELQP